MWIPRKKFKSLQPITPPNTAARPAGKFASSRKADRPISTDRLTNTYETRLLTPVPGLATILQVKILSRLSITTSSDTTSEGPCTSLVSSHEQKQNLLV